MKVSKTRQIKKPFTWIKILWILKGRQFSCAFFFFTNIQLLTSPKTDLKLLIKKILKGEGNGTTRSIHDAPDSNEYYGVGGGGGAWLGVSTLPGVQFSILLRLLFLSLGSWGGRIRDGGERAGK